MLRFGFWIQSKKNFKLKKFVIFDLSHFFHQICCTISSIFFILIKCFFHQICIRFFFVFLKNNSQIITQKKRSIFTDNHSISYNINWYGTSRNTTTPSTMIPINFMHISSKLVRPFGPYSAAALVSCSQKIFRCWQMSDLDCLFHMWVYDTCINFFKIFYFFVQLIFLSEENVFICSTFISNYMKVNLSRFFLNFCDNSSNLKFYRILI